MKQVDKSQVLHMSCILKVEKEKIPNGADFQSRIFGKVPSRYTI